MAIHYTGSGGIRIGGCAGTKYIFTLTFRFAEGSIVYFCAAARKGRLEKVAIKKVNLVNNKKTFGKVVPIYKDTFNSLYNEDELCTEREAITLAMQFYQSQADTAQELILNC